MLMGMSAARSRLRRSCSAPDWYGLGHAIGVPCSAAYFWEFGFVSIPLMALAAFAAVSVLLAMLSANQQRPHSEASTDSLAQKRSTS